MLFKELLNMEMETMSGLTIKQLAKDSNVSFIYVVSNNGWIRNIYQPFNEINDEQKYEVIQSTTPKSLHFPFSKRITIDLE